MLLVRKDKRKIAAQKGMVWNGEIKFEPVLVFGSYEGVGNARIRLWKPLTYDKPTEPKNVRKRKHKTNSNLSKPRGRSQTITTSQKLVTKQLVNVNGNACAIKGKKSNEKNSSTGNSSIQNKTNKSTTSPIGSYSSSSYSDQNKEYYIEDGSVSGSDNINYTVDDLMTSEGISNIIFPHNLIEYHSNIDEENNFFNPHNSDNTKQNKVYVSSRFTTNFEALNVIPDNLMQSDLNNKSYSESIFHSTGIKLISEEEDKLFESNKNKNKEYTRESKHLSDNTNQNTVSVSSKYTTDREVVNNIPESLMKPNLNNVSYSERITPTSGTGFPSENEPESKLLESNTNQEKEYVNGQFTIESEAMKHIADDLTKLDLNSISNSESIFPNTVKFLSDDVGENKLFESNMNKNEEYVSSQYITVSEILKNIPDKLTNSEVNKRLNSENFYPDLSEFPSDNMIYPNTSQYTGPNSAAFSSLENLRSESDDFYQNAKKNWSLDSSKVLMTPSKVSIKSKNSVASGEYDMIKVDENHNVDFTQLLDIIEGNLNHIIDEHQLSEQTISKLQGEEDKNSNDLKNDQIIQLKDYRNNNLNDHQYKNQMDAKLQENVNDNSDNDQFSNNNIKFIVLKKSQENQETILDSSEEISKNVFNRNNVLPGFENFINISEPRPCENEDKFLTEEADYPATSKNYSLAHVLHDELTKNNGTINFETRVKVTKVDQEQNRKIVEKNNFTHPNNVIEDQTVTKTVHNSLNNNVQKENGGESECELSLQSNEEEEKSITSSFIAMHTAQKYFNAFPECTSSQRTTLSKPEKIYLEEILKKSLEHVSEEKSGKTIGNFNEKNMETNENIYNTFFKHNNKNHPSLSIDPNNNFPMMKSNKSKSENEELLNNNFPMMKSNESKSENEELLYHLVSKSNHNVEEVDEEFSEIKKCTDDIINKIIKANTHEALLLLMKPRHPKMKEVATTNGQEIHTSSDRKGTKHFNNDFPLHLAFECNHTNQNIIHSSHTDDFIKTYEREASVKDKLHQKFTSSNTSLKNSINIIHSIATPSCNMKEENETPENFRLISEEKEQSNHVMNVEINHMQRTDTLEDSIINVKSSTENSTGTRHKNIQDTNLFYTKNVIKSPYINPHSKQNMIVNFDNERKNSVPGKLVSCFRKLNIWSKRKSATSLSSKESYSNNRYI